MTDKETSNPSASAPADQCVSVYACFERHLIELRPINKQAVFAAHAATGVTHVIVDFDGYGDSGQIENFETKCGDAVAELPAANIEWLTPVWDSNETKHSNLSLHDAIEHLVYG
jgi:hypothetical protein